MPGVADFFKGVIPDNVIAAAANGDVLPLVVFSLLFALAVDAHQSERRARSVVGLFEAIADALLVIIGWVLWIAPLGVFALAFAVGRERRRRGVRRPRPLYRADLGHRHPGDARRLSAGDRSAGGSAWRASARAMIAPQSVAISTRSSLASLAGDARPRRARWASASRSPT